MDGDNNPEQNTIKGGDHIRVQGDQTAGSALHEDSQHKNSQEQNKEQKYWHSMKTAGTQSFLPNVELTGSGERKGLSRGLAPLGPGSVTENDGGKKTITSQENGYTTLEAGDKGEKISTFHGDDGTSKKTIGRPDGSTSEISYDKSGRTIGSKDTDANGQYKQSQLNADGSVDIINGKGQDYVQDSFDKDGTFKGKEETWFDRDGTRHIKETDPSGTWAQTDDNKDGERKYTIGSANGDFKSAMVDGNPKNPLFDEQQVHTNKPDGTKSDDYYKYFDGDYHKHRETDARGNYKETEYNKGAVTGSAQHTINGDGTVSDTKFDASGNTVVNRDTRADGSFNEQAKNADGSLEIKEQDAAGNFKTAKYTDKGDLFGAVTHQQRPDGSSSEFESSKDGSVRNRETASDGSFAEQKLDGKTQSLTMHEEQSSGSSLSATYDSKMAQTSKTVHDVLPDGSMSDTRYNSAGEVVSNRDTRPDGSFIQQERGSGADGALRTTEYDRDTNTTWETNYNKKGGKLSESVVRPFVSTENTTYDSHGNFKQTYENQYGEKRATTGDAAGNFHDKIYETEKGKSVLKGERIHKNGPDGSQSTSELSKGQKIREAERRPDGSFSEKTWNQGGKPKSTHFEDAQGNFKHQSFGENGQLTSETRQTRNDDGSSTRTRYDGSGQIISNRETQKDGSFNEQYLKADGSINLYSEKTGQAGPQTHEEEYDPQGNKVLDVAGR